MAKTEVHLSTVRSALIVDDNEADIFWCRRTLERSGRYRIIHAVPSASEALDLIQSYERTRVALPELLPPMVVFLDINMPGLDGFGFLDALEACAEILVAADLMPSAVVVLSGSEDERDKLRAHSREIVIDYVVKPLAMADADRLAAAVLEVA